MEPHIIQQLQSISQVICLYMYEMPGCIIINWELAGVSHVLMYCTIQKKLKHTHPSREPRVEPCQSEMVIYDMKGSITVSSVQCCNVCCA